MSGLNLNGLGLSSPSIGYAHHKRTASEVTETWGDRFNRVLVR
jgi:hypothetical protein